MTHFQEIFIKNLRYFRTRSGYSQLKFSEILGISPNYLNAVENGKNFPSPEVIQRILDALDLEPQQFFLEQPAEHEQSIVFDKMEFLLKDLKHIKEQFNFEVERIIAHYYKNKG